MDLFRPSGSPVFDKQLQQTSHKSCRFFHTLNFRNIRHMTLKMSVMIVKSNWVMNTWAGFLPSRTSRKTTLENISTQFDIHSMKVDICYAFDIPLIVLQFKFCLFLAKNCRKFFSKVVFLIVPISRKPPIVPNAQLDFVVITDISNVMCRPLA